MIDYDPEKVKVMVGGVEVMPCEFPEIPQKWWSIDLEKSNKKTTLFKVKGFFVKGDEKYPVDADVEIFNDSPTYHHILGLANSVESPFVFGNKE